MAKHAYHLYYPRKRTTCVVFASPHSGDDYSDFSISKTQLNETAIRSSEDAYVDRLFESATGYGAPFLKAGAPRAFVDLNRAEGELDPALIAGVKSTGHNPRVAVGLGVIPRVVANGRVIYNGKIPLSEAQRRLATYWHPYHTALQAQLDLAKQRFGCAILIDCHSMPHEALDVTSFCKGDLPDIVLGDRFGASASSVVVDGIEAAFVKAGFKVARNAPFAGAYTVQRYGRPSINMHAVQVEIDRSLYMDEANIQPNEHFSAVQERLNIAIAAIADLGRPEAIDVAAE